MYMYVCRYCEAVVSNGIQVTILVRVMYMKIYLFDTSLKECLKEHQAGFGREPGRSQNKSNAVRLCCMKYVCVPLVLQ